MQAKIDKILQEKLHRYFSYHLYQHLETKTYFKSRYKLQLTFSSDRDTGCVFLICVVYPNLNCCCFYVSTFIVVVIIAFRIVLLHRKLQEFLQFWTVCRNGLYTTSANVRIYCLFNWKKPTDFRSKEQKIEGRYRLGRRVYTPVLLKTLYLGLSDETKISLSFIWSAL